MPRLTLADVIAMDAAVISLSEVAQVMGSDPNYLRKQAKEDKGALGFPIIQVCTHYKVPRLAFIEYMTGEPVAKARDDLVRQIAQEVLQLIKAADGHGSG